MEQRVALPDGVDIPEVIRLWKLKPQVGHVYSTGNDRACSGVKSPSPEEKDDSGYVQQRVFLSVMEEIRTRKCLTVLRQVEQKTMTGS